MSLPTGKRRDWRLRCPACGSSTTEYRHTSAEHYCHACRTKSDILLDKKTGERVAPHTNAARA